MDQVLREKLQEEFRTIAGVLQDEGCSDEDVMTHALALLLTDVASESVGALGFAVTDRSLGAIQEVACSSEIRRYTGT